MTLGGIAKAESIAEWSEQFQSLAWTKPMAKCHKCIKTPKCHICYVDFMGRKMP